MHLSATQLNIPIEDIASAETLLNDRTDNVRSGIFAKTELGGVTVFDDISDTLALFDRKESTAVCSLFEQFRHEARSDYSDFHNFL